MKLAFIILLICVELFAASDFALAQTENDDKPIIIESSESGEINSAQTDAMRSEVQGERLFVIVRLGTGETNRRINEIRLSRVKAFMLNKGFDRQTSVFAEGERVEGEGRIEYYIGSRLRLVTLAPRNRTPNLTCCEDYFPPTKQKPKRKPRKVVN